MSIGSSRDELQALADSKLAPAAQNQLNDLLVQNAESQLSADEVANLDRLLAQVDRLTILKTRARYTLHCLETLATVAWAHIFLLSYSDKFVPILEFAAPIAARLKLWRLQFLSLNTLSPVRLVARQFSRIFAFPVLPVMATKPLSKQQ